MKDRVIVFGGSGFLGSHVSDVLTDKGYDVVIFDLKPSRYLKKNQHIVIGNIQDEAAVSKAVKGADIIYNFAGITDIDEAKKEPLETVKNNILGNSVILEACRKNKVKRYIFASTIYVYSQKGSFYRSSKQACELIIENYSSIYGISYTILRYGSLYGLRADERNSIHMLLKQSIEHSKISYWGTGEEVREYINIEDAARLSVEVLSDDFKDQYVIISGPQSIKTKDLLMMVKEILGKDLEIEFRSDENGNGWPYDPESHYLVTPYSFNYKTCMRLMSQHYLDMGQGLLKCIREVTEKKK
jgi:UDP-glucose 4-epimerase